MGGSYNPMAARLLYSMASQMPTLSQKAAAGSNFPAPQPPQVLSDALKSWVGQTAPPASAAQAPSPATGMFGGAGNRAVAAAATPAATPVNRPPLPVTPTAKVMVTKWATQLGYKAYYEAHGCVDPAATLLGGQARMASLALMMGCNNFQANEVCDMAQTAHSGGQGAGMRTMISMMMGKDTKHMLEECLTPATLMNGIGGMMGSNLQGTPTAPSYGAAPAAASHTKKPVDCSGVTQMMMMSTAQEGLLNPEALEQIGTMRNRYFKMTCQENLIFGSLPYRICCPGHVKEPTMQEAMMMRGMAGM